jgi:hypothetical protein
MDPIIIKGVAEAPFPNTYALAILDAVKVIKDHIPSLSDEDEDLIYERVTRWDEDVTAADYALRTCHCGKQIDGFYEYVDHLMDLLK